MVSDPSPLELATRIEAHVHGATGDFTTVRDIAPLTLGPARRAWRVDLTRAGTGDSRMVLRADGLVTDVLSCEREFAVNLAAAEAGVTVPRAMWLGQGVVGPRVWSFFTPWAVGITSGDRVLRAQSLSRVLRTLSERLAQELARLHRITPHTHPDLLGPPPPPDFAPCAQALASLRTRLNALHEPRPAMAWAWIWLKQHLPPPGPVTLVHGDFRTGRFLLAPTGLTAITGWSRAHWGSPHEDFATISTRRWRFGHDALAVGGFAHRETFLNACAEASGRPVDRARVHWWEIAANLRLALSSVLQAEAGQQRGTGDIEVLAQARRAVELEFEALRLIAKGTQPEWD